MTSVQLVRIDDLPLIKHGLPRWFVKGDELSYTRDIFPLVWRPNVHRLMGTLGLSSNWSLSPDTVLQSLPRTIAQDVHNELVPGVTRS